MKWVVYGLLALLLATAFLGAAIGAAASPSVAAPGAVADIPPAYLVLYQDAGARFGVPWQVVAAIGRVESDHGRNPACYRPNSAGAVGPMQFLPATFAEYSWAAGHPGADILDPADAIPAAAAMLARNGMARDVHGAVFSYNHLDSYVNLVLSWATRYGWSMPADATGGGA